MRALAPTTAAATHRFDVHFGPCTVVAANLAGAEEIAIHIYAGVAAATQPYIDPAGEAVVLTADIPNVVLPGPGRYYAVKPITVAPVGLMVYEQR